MPTIPVCSTYDKSIVGGMEGWKACKLKADGYDPVTKRVMFKFDSINPAHLSPMAQEIYSVFNMLNKVFVCEASFERKVKSSGYEFERPLRSVTDPLVGREQLRSIGVAGSAALALLEGHLATKEDGRLRGRWGAKVTDYHFLNGSISGDIEKDLVIMEMLHTRSGEFRVKDVDVFLTRGYSYEPLGFTVASDTIVREITSLCGSRGITVKAEEVRKNWYVERDELVLIRDVSVGDGKIKISLIQQPCSEDIDDVVDNFDINVCKVVYNPFDEVLYAELATVDNIWKGTTSVIDLESSNGGPDRFDVARITSTIRRMYKYHQRGYIIDRLPNIFARGSPVAAYESDSDSD